MVVGAPLSKSLLGDGLENRLGKLCATLPIRRVDTSADVAAVAMHIVTNTVPTGAS